ncbi:MAG: diguanylate cyclase [Deltaproteobacteria bacterium]|nr:diguanylate cyclase [Deltaproteobacteria bacterium]
MDQSHYLIFEETVFNYLTQLEIMRALRYQNYVTLLLMEPDQSINNTRKFEGLAKILRDELRSTDVLGRVNHVRFGAILIHANLESAYLAGERIRSRIQDYFYINDGGLTISIGGACCPSNGTSTDLLTNLAENMLNSAKETGGNHTFFPKLVEEL